MGKYIRKCRGGGTGTAAPAVVVAGARTRSRSAAEASAPSPKRPRKATATRAEVELDKGREDDGGAAEGCCYLQLRSRRLFMVVAPEVAVAEEEEEAEASPAVPLPVTGSTASVEAVAGVSRCSSTASSVDAVAGVSRCSSTASSVDAAAIRVRNDYAVNQAREDCCEETSVSDSGCGRERREATPSSRAPGDLSDQESSKAADDPKHHTQRSSATAPSTVACKPSMPPAEEIEEFFAAAEKAEAERFAAKYNFDVVRGVPLDAGGRFEWNPVASG